MSLPQLSVELLAKSENFEKAFLKASETAVQAWNLIENRGAQGTSKLADLFGQVGKLGEMKDLAIGIAAAVAGFKGLEMVVGAFVSQAKQAQAELAELVKIGTGADNAQVGTSFFQAWTEQAKALSLEVSDVQGMLSNALNATAVQIGEGDAKKAASNSVVGSRIEQEVAARNLTQDQANTYFNAGTQEEKIRAVLNLLDQLMAKNEMLAAFDLGGKMFGPTFEAQMRNGVNMMEKMRQALDKPPADIIPPDVIQRAQQLNDRVNEIDQKFRDGLAPIKQDILRMDQQSLSMMLDMEDVLANMAVKAGDLYKWFKGVADQISGIMDSGFMKAWQSLNDIGNSSFFKDAAGWMDQHGLINHDMATGAPEFPGARPLTVHPTPPDVSKDKSHTLPSLNTGAGDTSQDAVESFIAGLEKSAAALKAETDAYNLNNTEKAIAINLAKAQAEAAENNQTVSPEEVQRIRDASTAIATLTEKKKELDAAKERTKGLEDMVGTDLISLFKGAASGADGFRQALNNIVQSLEELALKALLLGEGPLAGLFGSGGVASGGAAGGIIGMLFKGMGFATGGEIRGEGTGTSDSIPAMLSNGEFVVKADAAKKFLPLLHAINGGVPHFATGGMVGGGSSIGSFPGGSQSITVAPTINLHAQGGTEAQNADLAKQMSDHVEAAMRRVVVSELQQQMRVGNMLNPYGG